MISMQALFIMYVMVNGEFYESFSMEVPDLETCEKIGETFPTKPLPEMEIVISCATKEISA